MAKKRGPSKSEEKRLAIQTTWDLPPTMTTTATQPAAVTVTAKQVLRKITLSAGQDGRYDVDFESGELITRQEVRKIMAALQRGYNKYLSNLRKNKGARK